jgi:hypothetical protein
VAGSEGPVAVFAGQAARLKQIGIKAIWQAPTAREQEERLMKNLIRNHLDGRTILFLFVITNVIYATMLWITIPSVMQFSGGMNLLDMLPTGYTHDYVRTLFDTLGSQGRDAYLFRQIPVDMLYPGLFAVTYCLVTAYLLNKLGKLDSPLFYGCLIPVFSGFFDYGENAGIIAMLNSYPNNSSQLTHVTNVFSILKSISTTVCFVFLLLCLTTLGKRKLFPAGPQKR